MKAIPLAIGLEIVGSLTLAQTPDPMAHLRACATLEAAARLECLDKLSRSIAPAEPPGRREANWIVSETTSPVDYTPIITATTTARGVGQNALARLSIYCRGGRTELVVSGPAMVGGSTEYAISYRIAETPPQQVAAGASSFGLGAAFRVDVVRLLLSMPDDGDFHVRLAPRAGNAYEGHFSLAGLKAVRDRIAAACRWPNAMAKPGS